MTKASIKSWGLGILCSIALHGLAAAQEPSTMSSPPTENNIEAWLRSGEPRLEAWGAYYAGRSGNRGWGNDLIAMLRTWEPLPHPAINAEQPALSPSALQRQGRDAVAAVLDALITLKVPVPVDLLRKTALDLPDETVVLSARMPAEEVQPMLLEWWHGAATPDAYYGELGLKRVAAAMLALHPPAHFAAELMRETHVAVRFEVYTPGHAMGMGVSFGCGSSMGALKPPADWPPITDYEVHETSAEGDADPVLIAGVDPIRLRTHAGPGYERYALDVYLNDRAKARLVAEMLRVEPKSLPWWQGGPDGIAYESDTQYVAEVRAKLAAKEAAFAGTLAELRRQGLVSEEEAGGAFPQIDASVADYRRSPADGAGNARPKLPQIAVSEPNVHWPENAWSTGAWK